MQENWHWQMATSTVRSKFPSTNKTTYGLIWLPGEERERQSPCSYLCGSRSKAF